jgi:Domain of unknown function (DUF1772)
MKTDSTSRLLPAVLVIGIVLVGVQLGVSYAHFMQMNGKLQLPLDSYILVQNLVISYRVKLSLIEFPALAATLVSAILLRGRPRPFRLSLIALFCLIAMWLVWLFFIQPINAQIDRWTVATAPQDWPALRLQWHQFHLVRLALGALAMLALVLAGLGAQGRITLPNSIANP